MRRIESIVDEKLGFDLWYDDYALYGLICIKEVSWIVVASCEGNAVCFSVDVINAGAIPPQFASVRLLQLGSVLIVWRQIAGSILYCRMRLRLRRDVHYTGLLVRRSMFVRAVSSC